MKAKIMKKIEKYEVKVNPELDLLMDLPLFQDKIDDGNALLARVGIPSALKDRLQH
jgi:hypothetical protein